MVRLFLLLSYVFLGTAAVFANDRQPGWLVSMRPAGTKEYLATVPSQIISPFATVGHERFYSSKQKTDFKLEGILRVKKPGKHIFQIRTISADLKNKDCEEFARVDTNLLRVIVKVADKIVVQKKRKESYSTREDSWVFDATAIGGIQIEKTGEYYLSVLIEPHPKEGGWCEGKMYSVHVLIREPKDFVPVHLSGENVVSRVSD